MILALVPEGHKLWVYHMSASCACAVPCQRVPSPAQKFHD